MTTEEQAVAEEPRNKPLPWSKALPPRGASADEVLSAFLDGVAARGLELYPAQEEALLEIAAGKNVILNTPTGSGKSLVAEGMHFFSMAEDRRSVYTSPIKALVNEKFFDLCNKFGPEWVGLMTGDAAVNRDAPIVCCTAEILSNWALRDGENTPFDYVVMDEFHYYSDRDRGAAWQVPLLTMPRSTFLLMSATFGPTEPFEGYLNALTRKETAVVKSNVRPVPLDFEYREKPLFEAVADLVNKDRAPIYVVNFTQRGAAEEAQNLMSTDYCSKEEKRKIAEALAGVSFDSPYGKDVQRFLKHGIGLHHAGLLPKYRLTVEKLAQKGLLKVVSGTDTLGVGVNIPIRTVLFTKLCKFDGEKTGILSVRDFQQISGRAGRKGFDDRGTVVALAPEHVIENRKLEAKAAGDPVKLKRIVRRKPPERGYVHWDNATFEKLRASLPEPLVSRFQVTHGMLLNVLARPENGCQAMKALLKTCHLRPAERRIQQKHALALFRSLYEAKILEFVPFRERELDWETGRAKGSGVRVHTELQENFSIHQTLGLYLLDTIPLLEVEDPEYPLQLLSVVESILEDPEIILQKQLDKMKREKLGELKAQGVEYEERMAELEKLEYPKPLRDFIYGTFNQFSAPRPWMKTENIRPKSVAREMYETFQSFHEYIREYGAERSEGLLLRYLTDVYKTLTQTVPVRAKTPEVVEMIAYFGLMVRGVDSSLVDEWERMKDPTWEKTEAAKIDPSALRTDITSDEKAFLVLVRNDLFRLMRALASNDYETAAGLASSGPDDAWSADRLEKAMAAYYVEHARIRTDPAARDPKKTLVEKSPDGAIWHVRQILTDPDDDNDWMLAGDIDLAASGEAKRPIFALREIRS
jgi:superfamily II RNA helicase